MRLPNYHYFFILLSTPVIALLVRASPIEHSEQPTVESILEKHIESQGGREILKGLISLEVEATVRIESQGIEYPVIEKVVSPDKLLSQHEFPVFGMIKEVLNGHAGWEWHPILGERPLDEGEIEDKRKESDLQRDLKLTELYEEIRIGPTEVIEEIETTQLILVDKQGRQEWWYFKENGDLFQQVQIVSSGPESEFESTSRYYESQTVDGFRFPGMIKMINPAYVAELEIVSLLVNQPIDLSCFLLPEPILQADN
jgi:hypothetical protein